jgi:hypothetical protein
MKACETDPQASRPPSVTRVRLPLRPPHLAHFNFSTNRFLSGLCGTHEFRGTWRDIADLTKKSPVWKIQPGTTTARNVSVLLKAAANSPL